METALDMKPVRLDMACSIAPMKAVRYNLSGLLGNFNADLAEQFYPPIVSTRLNVIVSELVNNVVENVADPSAGFDIAIRVGSSYLTVKVSNQVHESQYRKVQKHIAMIRNAADTKRLLAETIAKRKALRLRGGLGLIRLAAEIKSRLNVTFNRKKSVMTVVSRLSFEQPGGSPSSGDEAG
jgi:hypothetical protein